MSELYLEIVEGPEAGRLVSLTAPLEIGSDTEAGFHLRDEHAEPRHVRVTPRGDHVFVEDLGAPGGTFVNDAEVAAPTRMRPEDELQVGITVLQLRSAADVAARGSAARPKPPPLAATERPPGHLPAEAEQDPMLDEIESLLDARTKAKARTAPLALFVLVVFAVLVFLATNRF